ncbi:MAG: hypothetical protein NWR17_02305 [Candidatus Nanopelagicales bacterium]|nr:hypothetical protein [Candidatus Nanopelagicales bacterium]MDP4974508.1 hypothetical protein [Candidatus Nanopelagicales bacterium]
MSETKMAEACATYIDEDVAAAGLFSVDGVADRLVAVSTSRFVIFDGYDDTPEGYGPTSILAEFDRDTTSLQFEDEGHLHHVTLQHGDSTATLSGDVTAFGHGSQGRRHVLEAMGSPSV